MALPKNLTFLVFSRSSGHYRALLPSFPCMIQSNKMDTLINKKIKETSSTFYWKFFTFVTEKLVTFALIHLF